MMKLDTKGLVIVDRCWFSTRSHFAIKLFRFLYSSSPSLPRSSPSAVRVIGYKLTAHSSNVAHFRRRGPRTISGFDLSLNPLFHLPFSSALLLQTHLIYRIDSLAHSVCLKSYVSLVSSSFLALIAYHPLIPGIHSLVAHATTSCKQRGDVETRSGTRKDAGCYATTRCEIARSRSSTGGNL